MVAYHFEPASSDRNDIGEFVNRVLVRLHATDQNLQHCNRNCSISTTVHLKGEYIHIYIHIYMEQEDMEWSSYHVLRVIIISVCWRNPQFTVIGVNIILTKVSDFFELFQ